jgi:ribosomal protein S27AE
MRIENKNMRCKKCGKDVTVEMLLDVSIELWIAACKELKCPSCGASYRSLAL